MNPMACKRTRLNSLQWKCISSHLKFKSAEYYFQTDTHYLLTNSEIILFAQLIYSNSCTTWSIHLFREKKNTILSVLRKKILFPIDVARREKKSFFLLIRRKEIRPRISLVIFFVLLKFCRWWYFIGFFLQIELLISMNVLVRSFPFLMFQEWEQEKKEKQ